MDLSEVLEKFRVPFKKGGEHRHVTSSWIGTDCPSCSPNTGKFKLGFNPETLSASCWTCGSMPFGYALSLVTDQSSGTLHDLVGWIERKAHLPQCKHRGKLVLPEGLGPLLPAHKRYLRGRKLRPKDLERLWEIRGIGIAPKWAWSIWIPIQRGHETISWTTRIIDDQPRNGRRYGNARNDQEALPAKSTLFGLDYVRHAAIIVEGAFDVFRIGPGAVATMGIKITDEQILLMSKIPNRIICLDSEPLAQIRARRLFNELACFPGNTLRVELDAKDAGSASDREIRLLRKSFLD